jgi:threonine/homoserine/homoserine lactone efflux protein
MKSYAVFFVLAAATVASPGPGVLLTLTNAMQFGMTRALFGIVGIAFGAITMATISASSIGLIVASSAAAFTALKYLGAMYLVYLGWKVWFSAAARQQIGPQVFKPGSNTKMYLTSWWEGTSLQFTNPKSLLFFMSILPQFIDGSDRYVNQVAVLIVTYSLLVIAIHCGYGLAARQARQLFSSPRALVIVRRASGACFMAFGLTLATVEF